MKVISISTDRKIFDVNSAVRQRQIEYGNIFDELHLVIFTPDEEKFKDEKLSQNVFLHPIKSKVRSLYILDYFKIVKKIIRKIDKESSVLTVQDPFETGLVGVILKLFYGIALQIQLHTDFNNKYFIFSSPLNFIRFFVAHLTLPFADEVRTVSDRSKDSIKELSKNISVLPIYTEVAKEDINHENQKNSENVSVLTVARLEKEKNIETAIKAFAMVHEKNSEAEFVIVGDGNERNNLERLAQRLGIGNKVRFVGWQDNPNSFYKKADIYISTSLFEGYGMSVIEAANHGLALVLSNAGVAGEIFENNKSAFICNPKDESSLAQALDKLITNPNLRKNMSMSASLEIIKRKISWEEYLSLYRKSIKNAFENYKPKNIYGRTTQFIGLVFQSNKVLRFVIAGLTAATTQIVVLYVFTDVFNVWYLYSSIISYAIALFVSFFLQKMWAFRDKNLKGAHIQFLKYALIIATGGLLNTIMMYLWVDIVGLWYIIAQIITGAFIAVLNFFSYKKFIFKTE